MRIIQNTFAVFWKSSGNSIQCHADLAKLSHDESASDAIERFREMFPSDIVCSVRDGNGRFVKFQN